MEPNAAIAIALRPIVSPILFFLFVAPIAWLLYRVFPPGRLKVILFRQRTGPHATRRDKWVIGVAAVVAQGMFFGLIFVLGAGML